MVLLVWILLLLGELLLVFPPGAFVQATPYSYTFPLSVNQSNKDIGGFFIIQVPNLFIVGISEFLYIDLQLDATVFICPPRYSLISIHGRARKAICGHINYPCGIGSWYREIVFGIQLDYVCLDETTWPKKSRFGLIGLGVGQYSLISSLYNHARLYLKTYSICLDQEGTTTSFLKLGDRPKENYHWYSMQNGKDNTDYSFDIKVNAELVFHDGPPLFLFNQTRNATSFRHQIVFSLVGISRISSLELRWDIFESFEKFIDEFCDVPSNCLGKTSAASRFRLQLPLQVHSLSFPTLKILLSDGEPLFIPPKVYLKREKDSKFCIDFRAGGYNYLGYNVFRSSLLAVDLANDLVGIRKFSDKESCDLFRDSSSVGHPPTFLPTLKNNALPPSPVTPPSYYFSPVSSPQRATEAPVRETKELTPSPSILVSSSSFSSSSTVFFTLSIIFFVFALITAGFAVIYPRREKIKKAFGKKYYNMDEEAYEMGGV